MTSARSFTSRDSQLGLHRSGWWKAATWLLVATLLFVATSAAIEAQFGADARPHVELAGTNTHHAHNPADCATCAARGMLAVADRSAPSVLLPLRPALSVLPEVDTYLHFLRDANSRPRAPPFRHA